MATQKIPPTSNPSASNRSDAPTHDEIALMAYEIYLSRGATDGQDLEDWFQAERTLFAQPETSVRKSRTTTA